MDGELTRVYHSARDGEIEPIGDAERWARLIDNSLRGTVARDQKMTGVIHRFPVSPGVAREVILELAAEVRKLRPAKAIRTCCDDLGCEAMFAWIEVEA
jgi:hypothetical protein